MHRMMRALIPIFFTLCLQAQKPDFAIVKGLVDDQVLQRDGAGKAAVELQGTGTLNDREVEVRVLDKTGPLPGLDWKPAGRIAREQWSAKLELPTGGPYRVEARVAQSGVQAAITGVLVGDLWLLAGQSNMEGVGDLVGVEPPNGLVHSFDMADRWGIAEEPLHTLVSATDRVHWRRNANKEPERYEGERLTKYVAARRKGAGLGLPFAAEMVKRTGVPVGLLPCAHGGTSMDQWSPDLRDQGGDSLYGGAIRRARLAGGKVAGILWYQGESDASPKAAPEFRAKFEKLVAAFRSDLGQAEVPFYYVQIGRHVATANANEWNHVQEMQRQAESAIPYTGMVTAIDLALDDGIHVGVGDLKLLGRRMANLACHDRFPGAEACGWLKRGPRPISVRYAGNRIRIRFAEVNGKLTSLGRVSGFSVHDAAGAVVPFFYRAEIDSTDPTAIVLHAGGKLPEGATLRYGAGKDPYCNVRDQAGMALPVFGPLAIEQ